MTLHAIVLYHFRILVRRTRTCGTQTQPGSKPRNAACPVADPVIPAAEGCHMMKRIVLVALFLFCMLAGLRPALPQSLEMIELRNKPAEQIIPVLRPMLDRDGVITGSGFQLMVRTSPQNLAQIRQMVASLDRAARQLLIQVRQDSDVQGNRFDARGNVVLAPGNSRAAGSINDSSLQGSSNIAQQVRVQEGSPAYIGTGTSQVLPQRTVRRTVNGVVVQDTVVERDLATGFYVTARVAGDNVMLDISTQRETPAPGAGLGAAQVSRTATSISGRLGEWIEVSGVNQSRSTDSSGLLARSSAAGSNSQRVYLRVEEAR